MCVWNETVKKDELSKGCIIEYHFPQLDQKIVGDWVFVVLLYDDAEGVLVSYEAKEFTVTDVPSASLWLALFGIIGIAGLTIAVRFLAERKRRKRRKIPIEE